MENTGLKRNTIDKFYTSHHIVNMCMSEIVKTINIDKNDLIVEPSAGNGSFIEPIKTVTNHYLFLDIEPENHEIKRADFLIETFDFNKSINQKIHVIGNPPFGRQSSLAIKFIKKACEFCDTLSFILPKSFKKESFKKYFPLNFHLRKEIDLPENSFIVNQKSHNVPCILQIWEKLNITRYVEEKHEPINFQFVKKNENPHASIRRVGFYAGYVDNNYIDKNIQSHYFIRFKNEQMAEKYIKILNEITFAFDNTVGPRSLSKQEIIKAYNEILKNE